MNQSRGRSGEPWLTLRAPAKINLHLAVGEKRPDAFHDLESVFAALDFADTLGIRPDSRGSSFGTKDLPRVRLSVAYRGPAAAFSRRNLGSLPPERNLVCRAAELFRSETGFSAAVEARLVKRIPPGSGLGGGSSNAAAALLILNVLAGRIFAGRTIAGRAAAGRTIAGDSPRGLLSGEKLLDLAARLGSDVPFFVHAGLSGENACAAAGRGEILRPLPPPPPWGVLLAFPGFASPTGAAFRLLDSRRGPGFRRADLRRAEPRRVFSQSAGALSEGKPWPAPEQWDFYNDFLDLFLDHGGDREKTGYGAALADLKRSGAVFTGLSGSGSACFGVFSRRKEARAAKKALAGGFYTLRDTFFLASPPKR